MEALYLRVDRLHEGQVDSAEMCDVSNTILQRNRVYNRKDWSFQERACGDLAILWGQNANTQSTLLWFIAFVYSTPDLFETLRDEVARFVSSSLFDIESLANKCAYLKASVSETLRLTNEATSIRKVEHSFKLVTIVRLTRAPL
jgi:hypothetical protein